MSRIIGVDLNGRYDLAARDWDEEGSALPIPRLIVGGISSAVVKTEAGRRVAGPQAELAPHGRGDGWGAIGGAEKRHPLAKAIDRNGVTPEDAADIGAAVDALTRNAELIMAAVPDRRDFDEAAQGAWLSAMAKRGRRVRLLWRPVAAFLDLVRRGIIDDRSVGQSFRLLVHVADGFEDQILTLRADPDHPGHIAPQRNGAGKHWRGLGLDELFRAASELVCATNPHIPWDRCELSHLGPRLVTGAAKHGATEILRLRNSNWVQATAPDWNPEFRGLEIGAASEPIMHTIIVTPIAAEWHQALEKSLSNSLGPVMIICSEAIALGCLYAGRLIERGLPHYFDRLEPVSIAVMRGHDPVLDYLIDPHDIVPANREYVSPDLGGFVWGKNRPIVEFYIVKSDREVRHWQVTRHDGPPHDTPVHLRIRQTPGQSWARLTVSSREWEPLERNPVALDWEHLTPLNETPAELLKRLKAYPTIPDIIVERPHIELWMGSDWGGNGEPARLARSATLGNPPSTERWADALKQSRKHPDPPQEKFWLVGTDGSVPEALPNELRVGLEKALGQFAEQVQSLTQRNPPRDNTLLQALTWSFALCPEPVQGAILDALEANALGRSHPLLAPPRALTVLRQGAGRSVTTVSGMERLFRYLDNTEFNTDTINALAMALTRREDAARALTRKQVDRFLNRLGMELVERIGQRNFAIRFQNTLSAIAGLFRFRTREPFAFLAEHDPVARELRNTLVKAQKMVERARNEIVQSQRKIGNIQAIVEYLDGRGDPDILRQLENGED